ncbi:MAG: sensor histidine kinase [Algoriphagus aquaeductus]|uniref:sensor histidine kinase n=1 Tax=Algoriphagus aquaeductus TaxID=475299 RepID=UPI00391A3D41
MGTKNNFSKTKLYWLLQVVGWSSIVFIETINYTIFIHGSFEWTFFQQFILYSLVGLFVSHGYKSVFIRERVFSRSLSRIWFKAFLDTLVIALMMAILLYLPYVFIDFQALLKQQTIISFFGQVMNLGRYVLVWIIIYYLYHILKRNSEISEQKLMLENVAKSAELELLKIQLNPHFLFNALNSIKALVLIDQEKSRDAIIKLSELLRFSLNYEKAPLISLNDEINEVIKYLELEQIRFGKRLEVEILIQEETLEQRIPPAMILTLAENAIKHGITKLPDGGKIKIESKIKGQKMWVELINSGQLEENFSMGIGLSNLEKRLQNLFPDKSSFHLDNFGDSHVKATLTYPMS